MTTTLEQLQADEWKRNHPNVPDYAKPKAKKVKSGANQLQNDIEDYCKLNKGFCEPVHTKGTFRKELGVYTSGNYIKGSSDLHIMLWKNDGELVVWKCEVKWNKDVQSEDQKKYEAMINAFNKRRASNGKGFVFYSIVKTFDDFLAQYKVVMNLKPTM